MGLFDISKSLARPKFEEIPALFLPARDGHTKEVKALISAGADVNAKAKNGTTALMAASYNGHTEIAQALIAARADVNAKSIFETEKPGVRFSRRIAGSTDFFRRQNAVFSLAGAYRRSR